MINLNYAPIVLILFDSFLGIENNKNLILLCKKLENFGPLLKNFQHHSTKIKYYRYWKLWKMLLHGFIRQGHPVYLVTVFQVSSTQHQLFIKLSRSSFNRFHQFKRNGILPQKISTQLKITIVRFLINEEIFFLFTKINIYRQSIVDNRKFR